MMTILIAYRDNAAWEDFAPLCEAPGDPFNADDVARALSANLVDCAPSRLEHLGTMDSEEMWQVWDGMGVDVVFVVRAFYRPGGSES